MNTWYRGFSLSLLVMLVCSPFESHAQVADLQAEKYLQAIEAGDIEAACKLDNDVFALAPQVCKGPACHSNRSQTGERPRAGSYLSSSFPCNNPGKKADAIEQILA